jgi:hypothetical protein
LGNDLWWHILGMLGVWQFPTVPLPHREPLEWNQDAEQEFFRILRRDEQAAVEFYELHNHDAVQEMFETYSRYD